MLRSAAGAARVRGSAIRGATRCCYGLHNAGTREVQKQLHPIIHRRRCAAAAAAGDAVASHHRIDTAKRTAWPVHHPYSTSAATTISRTGSGHAPFNPSHTHYYCCGLGLGSIKSGAAPPSLVLGRHLSTRRRNGLPQPRSLPEKIFAGVVMAVLAAWGLVFGGERPYATMVWPKKR